MIRFLVRLIGSLDLRFADPQAESLYHTYYAQVKRALLPTAIQVVLLVNLLQFLATCLNYYLLVDGWHQYHHEHQPPPHHDHLNHHQVDNVLANQQRQIHSTTSHSQAALETETNLKKSSIIMNDYARTLIWPLLMQIIVFVATFAMLKMVRAEMRSLNETNDSDDAKHSSESLSSSGNNNNKQQTRSAKKSGHSDGGNDDDQDNDSDNANITKSGEKISLKQKPRTKHLQNSSSSSWAKYTSATKTTTPKSKLKQKSTTTNTTSAGRHSGASGLSTSLSFAIEMPLTRKYSSQKDADDLYNDGSLLDDDNNDDSANESDRLKNETVRLSTTASEKTKVGGGGGSFEQQQPNRRRRFSSNCAQQTKLTRLKLSLPYVLWLCQLIQLSSGLWPQQSFIAYSTLLLYSYAIYVIFPIRLHSCILLASGLSLIQPILDYLLMLNLYSLFGQNGNNSNNNQRGGSNLHVDERDQLLVRDSLTSPLSSSLHNNYEENSDDFVLIVPHKLSPNQNNHHHSLVSAGAAAAANLTATTSDLIAQQLQNRTSSLESLVKSGYFPSRTIDSLLNNALEIPMTSQISKLWAFMFLILGINVIGIMSFFFYERQQRAAYLETRQSIETKLILEQESREQERLLLSILPKHLAAEIRQDLGAVVTGQFKKIYMSRHENVSILFADIVGFTAISSNCPAPELVKTLNELFARFDKLAEKYHQLRIKILGDCYYAISGAPKERPDHAVLCVHMGLSMVEAVKSVRERTKSTVDMRVGVHTGGVLAGVLGQRQWQFDVYSKDVELANKMESSGLPGRVHISNATLRFLNDEFEVTEGDGASREEALRLANIRTYFIDRVKKPYPEGTLDAIKPQANARAEGSACLSNSAAAAKNKTVSSSKLIDDERLVQDNQDNKQNRQTKTSGGGKQVGGRKSTTTSENNNEHELAVVNPAGNQQQHRQQQEQPQQDNANEQQQQTKRNDSFNLDKQIKQFSLNFSNRQFEKQFRSTSDIASCISLVGLPITLICAFLAYAYLYKVRLEVTIFYITNSVILLFIVLVCVLPYLWRKHSLKSTTRTNGETATTTTTTVAAAAPHQQQRRFQCLTKLIVDISEIVGRSAWIKLALSTSMTLIWLSAHLIACRQIVQQFESHQLIDGRSAESAAEAATEAASSQQNRSSASASSSLELFSVDLLNYYTITCALAVTAITRISFFVKTLLILIVILQQVILNKTILANILMLRSTMLFNQPSDEAFGGPTNANSTATATTGTATLKQPISSLLKSISLSSFETISADYNQFVFLLTLITICWALFFINRQFELTNRRLFLWRKQVEVRKEKVADMRRKNEALVYNILPPNVAKIFLSKRQFNDEELYSKSYDAVGVLFAAMPNFSDFYTEESVNNQGLECLRFLNEVISDYDALLDQPRFKNIIKIKTMSSTYMAASGLYEGDAQAEREAAKAAAALIRRGQQQQQQQNNNGGDNNANTSSPLLPVGAGGDSANGCCLSNLGGGGGDFDDEQTGDGEQSQADEIGSKWGHLEQLTEFALALKETLNNINKESFNNFVLRIGINQGPITAGVIGVKKPHFDIWGNTVNVASRMESTGRAGSIQVVEETAIILRHFGFEFDQRGLVSVKGKGKLMTFYLTGRTNKPAAASSHHQKQPNKSASSLSVGLGGANGQQPSQQPLHSQSQQQLAQNGNGSVPMDSRHSIVNCSKTTIVPQASGGAALATSNVNHPTNQAACTTTTRTSSPPLSGGGSPKATMTNSNNIPAEQQTSGGAPATTTTSTTNADTSDRRMFIRPSKPDFVGDSGADIDLV